MTAPNLYISFMLYGLRVVAPSFLGHQWVDLLSRPQTGELATLVPIDEVLMFARGKVAVDGARRGRLTDFFQYLCQAVTKAGGGQGRVAAQVHLDRGREPPQVVPARPAAHEERGLRQVHLAGDPLHPRRVGRPRQHADGGRIPAERLGGEGVDLDDRHAHAGTFITTAVPGVGRRPGR